MKKTFMDRVLGVISPQAAIRRVKARAMLEFYERSYDAAQTFKTDDWTSVTNASSNKENKTALPILRDKAQDAIRNNSFALRARDVVVGNTVGYGIRPNIKCEDKQKRELVRAAWKLWGETTLCDVEGKRNYYGLQAKALGSTMVSGEVVGNKVLVKESLVLRANKLAKPVSAVNKIQLLESDFIDSKVDNDKTVQGIELDPYGKRTGIWLYALHPGDKESKSTRYDGANIAHMFRDERPGQQRGVTWYHSVIRCLEDLKSYQEATLIRNKIAACYAIFLEEGNDTAFLSAEAKMAQLEQDSMVEPGLIKKLGPGQKVSFASPPALNDSDYVNEKLREVSVGIGITAESLSGNWSQVNFSSGRLGKNEMNRNIEMWQYNMLIPMWCEPTFKWFLEWCNLALGIDVSDITVEWTPPAKEVLDPATEYEAIKKAVRAGLKTLPEAIREQGYDPETFFEEVKAANDKIDALGLAFDTDPRKMSSVGFAQASDSFDKLLGNEPTQDTSSEQKNQNNYTK